MKKLFAIVALVLIHFITGCGSHSVDSSELEKYTVTQIEDETTQGDFVFRLVLSKAEYEEGEEVNMYGEIEYIGELEEVTIHHASSAIFFPLTEKIGGYEIHGGVDDIGLATTLKRGEPYREEYRKSGGYSLDRDPKDYVDFIRDFMDRKGFPSGYYVVNGKTDFSYEEERFNIEAMVDFKVVP